jgi:hypothetical protein
LVDQTHISDKLHFFTAFPSAPILSADEEFLYLAGASASILCVSADGSNVWSFVTDEFYMPEPVLSELKAETLYSTIGYVILDSDAGGIRVTLISTLVLTIETSDLDWLDPSV